MAVGDIYQVRIVFYDGDQVAENVVHTSVLAEAGTGATLAQIAGAYDTAVAAAALSLCNNTITYLGVAAKRIWPTQTVDSIASASQGPCSGVGANLPKQTAGLITLRTATPGRKGLGRIYTPFPPVAGSDAAGKVVPGYQGAITSYAGAVTGTVVAGIGANTTTLKVGVYNRTAHTLLPLTFVNTSNVWATQRRRGDYGRKNPKPF